MISKKQETQQFRRRPHRSLWIYLYLWMRPTKFHPNNYNFNDPTRWAAAKNAPPSTTPLQSPFKEWRKITREITQLIDNNANIFNNSYNWQNQKKKSNGKAQTLQQIHGKHNCQQEGTFIKHSKKYFIHNWIFFIWKK